MASAQIHMQASRADEAQQLLQLAAQYDRSALPSEVLKPSA